MSPASVRPALLSTARVALTLSLAAALLRAESVAVCLFGVCVCAYVVEAAW